MCPKRLGSLRWISGWIADWVVLLSPQMNLSEPFLTPFSRAGLGCAFFKALLGWLRSLFCSMVPCQLSFLCRQCLSTWAVKTPSNGLIWPVSNMAFPPFTADYTEQPKLLKLMQTCLEEHHSYCINGLCAFHSELRRPICK